MRFMDLDRAYTKGVCLIFSLFMLQLLFILEHSVLTGFFSLDGLLGSALLLVVFGVEVLGYVGIVVEYPR